MEGYVVKGMPHRLGSEPKPLGDLGVFLLSRDLHREVCSEKALSADECEGA